MHKPEQEKKAIKQLIEVNKAEYDELVGIPYLTNDFKIQIINFITDKMNQFTNIRANNYFFDNINYDLLGMTTNERTEYIKDTIKEFLAKNRKYSKPKLFNELELLSKYSFVDYLEFYKTGKIDIHKYSDYRQYLENTKIIEILEKEVKKKKASKARENKNFWEYINLKSDQNKKKLANYIVNLNKNEKGIKIAYSITALNKIGLLIHYNKTHLINSIKTAGCNGITNPENVLQYLRLKDRFYINDKEEIDNCIQLINSYKQKENLY